MNEYKTISEIPYSSERAVIVNVHTLLCTTLAILSTRRYMDMPLLVIDCPLHNESDADALRRLQKEYDFDLWCRMFQYSDLYSVNTVLGGFRQHGNQLSLTQTQKYNAEVMEITKYYNMIYTPSKSVLLWNRLIRYRRCSLLVYYDFNLQKWAIN